MNDHKILVTGATGLLGTYVISDLVAKGYTDINVLIRSGKLTHSVRSYTLWITSSMWQPWYHLTLQRGKTCTKSM